MAFVMERINFLPVLHAVSAACPILYIRILLKFQTFCTEGLTASMISKSRKYKTAMWILAKQHIARQAAALEKV